MPHVGVPMGDGSSRRRRRLNSLSNLSDVQRWHDWYLRVIPFLVGSDHSTTNSFFLILSDDKSSNLIKT